MRAQIHRCVWLAAVLVNSAEVTYTAYRSKFKLSERSYQRDLSIVSESGVHHTAKRDGGRTVLTGMTL